MILQEELLATQGCIHNSYTSHAVGLCQELGVGWLGVEGPAQAQQLVLKLSFIS